MLLCIIVVELAILGVVVYIKFFQKKKPSWLDPCSVVKDAWISAASSTCLLKRHLGRDFSWAEEVADVQDNNFGTWSGVND